MKIDENVFQLTTDTEIGYLEHFCAPFTGGDSCVVPAGTAFAPHGPMRADALYMHLVEPNESLLDTMRNKVKTKYDEHLQMCERLQGFPDNWTQYGKDNEPISDTQRYKCCGNAVTTNVITAIINEMFKEVIEDEND